MGGCDDSGDQERGRREGAHVDASTVVRLGDESDLENTRVGALGHSETRKLELGRGVLSFPADGSPWGEQGPCLVWRYQESGIAEDQNFAGIRVRIRDTRNRAHKFHVSFLSRIATVPLVPQRTMEYVVVPDLAAHADILAGEGLGSRDTVTLVFPYIEDKEELELISVEVLTRMAAYTEPSGMQHETLGADRRSVFYQWVGTTTAWRTRLPDRRATLKLGTGLFPGSPEAVFSVSLEEGGESHQVFGKTLAPTDLWIDEKIDLSAWSGRDVRIIFSTESSAPTVALWSSPRLVDAGRKGRLVCIYLVDALRPDYCEGFATGQEEPVPTPAIRRLAAQGARFTQAFSNAPFTSYSMPSLFTGRTPSNTGITRYQRLPEQIETMAEKFRREGYSTASFLFNPNSGQLRGLDQGFDHLILGNGNPSEADEVVVETVAGEVPADWFASGGMIGGYLFDFIRTHQEEDVFLFIHLMDTHQPYLPDEEFLEGFVQLMKEMGLKIPEGRVALIEHLLGWSRLPPSSRLPPQALLELYRGAVATADKHLGRFLDFLESEEILDRATIVLTADHGERLNDRPESGLFVHSPPMYLDVLRVPLILKAPGRVAGGGSVATPVQLADLMPTLLELEGIGHDPAAFDGVSILPLLAGPAGEPFTRRPIVSEAHNLVSVLQGGFHSPDLSASDPLVFDLENDPLERSPLTGELRQDGLRRLRESLMWANSRSVPEAETIVNEEEALRQLKALGYID